MNKPPYPKYRRRNYFIKKGLQGRFVLGFSATAFLGILLNLALVYILIDSQLTEELYKIHLKIRTTSEIAWPILWKLGALTIPAIIIAAFFIGYYLTRGVEMPLDDFTRAVRRISQGDFSQRLSKVDDAGLAGPFNKMAGSLEKKLSAIKASEGELEKSLGRLSTLLSREGPRIKAELSDALKRASEERVRAQQAVARFKV